MPLKKPKKSAKNSKNDPPPPVFDIGFVLVPGRAKRGNTQLLRLSDKKVIFVIHLNRVIMNKRLDLGNSIYQEKGSLGRSGLTVSKGMLINNREDGQTGIALMSKMKSEMKRAEKIATMSAAFVVGGGLIGGDDSCGM